MASVDTDDELAAVHSAEDPDVRSRLVEQFHTRRQALYARWARALCRTVDGVGFGQFDDVLQTVAETAVVTADQWDGPVKKPTWEQTTFSKAHDAVKAEAGRSRLVAGATSHYRRNASLRIRKSQMQQQLQREPSDDEVVEAHNADRMRTNKNPHKAGVIATVDDMYPAAAADSVEPDKLRTGDDPVLSSECILTTVEGPEFVKQVVERAEAAGEVTARVAQVWVGDYNQTLPTVDELAEVLDMSVASVHREKRTIEALAAAVLRDEFGLDIADWKNS